MDLVEVIVEIGREKMGVALGGGHIVKQQEVVVSSEEDDDEQTETARRGNDRRRGRRPRDTELSAISEDSESSTGTAGTLRPLHTKASEILSKLQTLNPSLASPVHIPRPSQPPRASPGSTVSRATQTSPPNSLHVTDSPRLSHRKHKKPARRTATRGRRITRAIQTDEEESGIPSSIPLSYDDSESMSSPDLPRLQYTSSKPHHRPPQRSHTLFLSPRQNQSSDMDAFLPRRLLFPHLAQGSLHSPRRITRSSPSARSRQSQSSVRRGTHSRSSSSDGFRVDSPYTAALRRRRLCAIESLRQQQHHQQQLPYALTNTPPPPTHIRSSSPWRARSSTRLSSPPRPPPFTSNHSRRPPRPLKTQKVRVFSVGRDITDSTFAEEDSSDNTPRQGRPHRSTRLLETTPPDIPRQRTARATKTNPFRGSRDWDAAGETTADGLTDLEKRVQALRIWGSVEEERKEFLMREIKKRGGRAAVV